jgi:hypothetical protein
MHAEELTLGSYRNQGSSPLHSFPDMGENEPR